MTAKAKRKTRRIRWAILAAAACLSIFAAIAGPGGSGAWDRAEGAAPAPAPVRYATHLLAKEEKSEFRVAPEGVLGRSEDCRPCHETVYRQWRFSQHAWAGRVHTFRKVAGALMERHGEDLGRHCAVCHNPEAALSGNVRDLVDVRKMIESDGVGCRACHYLNESRGKNGLFAFLIPKSDLHSNSPAGRAKYILGAVPEHVADNSKRIGQTGEACFPCHFLESVRNGEIKVPLDNVNSFLHSSFKDRMACHVCHMPRLERDGAGYAWMDHRFFGIQQELPEVAVEPSEEEKKGLERFAEETRLWLRGDLPAVETAEPALDAPLIVRDRELWRRYKYLKTDAAIRETNDVVAGGPHFDLRLESAERKDGKAKLVFSAYNRNVSHDFPSQLFANITEMWTECEVKDAAGRAIYKSKFIPGTLERQLGRIEIDEGGRAIDPIDSLKYVDIINIEYLEPEKKRLDEHVFELPANPDYPLSAAFRLQYRRYSGRFVEWFTDGARRSAPARVVAEASFRIDSLKPEKKEMER